jgi:phosphoglycolate phosphatase-like HAD superfamily hydrolase
MLHVALSRLGVPAHRAIVVGDSPNDVVAGRALGIPAIGVTYGIGSPRALARCRPERIVRSVDELRRELLGFVMRLAGGGR